MQPVSIYSYSYNNKPVQNLSFKGAEDKFVTDSLEHITRKTKKLIQCMNCHIDNTWKEIKSGRLTQDSPSFVIKNQKDEIMTVTPIYNYSRPSLMLETVDGKYTDRIMIDRQNPNSFRYERVVKTDHGIAAIKSFSSVNGTDREIEGLINKNIETFFPLVISPKFLREAFGPDYRKFLRMPFTKQDL